MDNWGGERRVEGVAEIRAGLSWNLLHIRNGRTYLISGCNGVIRPQSDNFDLYSRRTAATKCDRNE